MKPYSKDLRLRVLAAVDSEVPREEVAKTFSVAAVTFKRWLKRRRETGDVEPKPIPGRPCIKGAALEGWLPSHLEKNDDLTLEEHCEAFEEAHSGVREGQVVVLDRLGAHRTQRVTELIEARGADLVFLPSYSPDLNPIEEAFSKIKGLVRKVGARTREALVEAIELALTAVTPEDAAGWFAHAGYRPQDQSL